MSMPWRLIHNRYQPPYIAPCGMCFQSVVTAWLHSIYGHGRKATTDDRTTPACQ